MRSKEQKFRLDINFISIKNLIKMSVSSIFKRNIKPETGLTFIWDSTASCPNGLVLAPSENPSKTEYFVPTKVS